MTLSDSALISSSHIFRKGQGDGPGTASQSTSTCYDPGLDRAGAFAPSTIAPLSRPDLDAKLDAILDSPRHASETVTEQFRRKEHQIGSLLAALSVVDSLALHKRLATPRSGDALALKFARLVVDRKNRLLTFLSDAPRRAATTR